LSNYVLYLLIGLFAVLIVAAYCMYKFWILKKINQIQDVDEQQLEDEVYAEQKNS